MSLKPRLGINIDHIATLRQLRGTPYPDLILAAKEAIQGGAEQITVHLREDRRHIQDADVKALKKNLSVPLNLEMALSDPIIRFALKVRPEWVCLVPEKRQELTTEGGLDLKRSRKKIAQAIRSFHQHHIRVSLFIEPSLTMVRLGAELGADALEFHTGRYCLATQKNQKEKAQKELLRIQRAALSARELGIHPHAGHGIDYENVQKLVDLRIIEEFNIGHAVVCQAAFVGLRRAVQEMAHLLANSPKETRRENVYSNADLH